MTSSRVFAAIALSIGVGACGRGGAPARSAAQPAGAPSFATAGTAAVARLDVALGSTFTLPGEVFTARLVSPLRDAAGREIAHVGAPLWGMVVGVDQEPPALRLRFDSIETDRGVVPLHATVRQGVDERRFRALEVWDPRARYDAALWAPEHVPAIGGGPGAGPPLARRETAAAVALPAGTELELVLTRPLVDDPSAD